MPTGSAQKQYIPHPPVWGTKLVPNSSWTVRYRYRSSNIGATPASLCFKGMRKLFPLDMILEVGSLGWGLDGFKYFVTDYRVIMRVFHVVC